MLGILLIYFIGKKFFELADDYEKSKWGFAIVGVVTYYAVALSLGLLLGIVFVFFNSNFIENINEILLGLIIAPFGILGCYLLYISLEKKWKEEKPKTNNMIDNIGNDTDV